MPGKCVLIAAAAMALVWAGNRLAQDKNHPQKPIFEGPGPQAHFQEQGKQIRVRGTFLRARWMGIVKPVCPPGAIQKRVQDAVIVRFIVAKDGGIHSVRWVSVPSRIGEAPQRIRASMNKVRLRRYQPTLLNGAPVALDTTVTLLYRLAFSRVFEKPGKSGHLEKGEV